MRITFNINSNNSRCPKIQIYIYMLKLLHHMKNEVRVFGCRSNFPSLHSVYIYIYSRNIYCNLQQECIHTIRSRYIYDLMQFDLILYKGQYQLATQLYIYNIYVYLYVVHIHIKWKLLAALVDSP